MTTRIRSYRPEVQIWIDGMEYSDHLGDTGSVRLRKSLYAPTGEAYIDFPDMPTADRDSLYGTFPVMAPIKILARRWVDGEVVLRPFKHIFRGFVRSISRDEQVTGDGRAQRRVSIVAHDCGSAFVMQSIHHLITWQNAGAAIPAALQWLRDFDLVSQPMPAGDFLWDIGYNGTKQIMDTAQFEFERHTTVTKGDVLPSTALSTEGPLWEMMNRYTDRPWNELFVREGKEKVEFIFRPTPWRNSKDEPLPDAAASIDSEGPFVKIPMSNIVSLSAHRDDIELVNHVWVQTPTFAAADMVQSRELRRGILNEETIAKFGNRLQIQPTFLGPLLPTMNQDAGTTARAVQSWTDWIRDRVTWMLAAGEDTHEFERGSIVVKGDPEMMVGKYFTVERGPLQWDGYGIGVGHDFQPYRRYLTTIEYVRSNQWTRRQKIQHPWDLERAEKAVPIP